MFDIGFWEMAFIGVIALIVIGPERLPRVARNVGLWVGKGRRMISDIKADVKKEMDAEDLAQMRELKNEISSATKDLNEMAKVDIDKDPLGIKEAGESIKQSVEGGSTTENSSGTAGQKKSVRKKTTKKSTAKKSKAKKAAAKKPPTKKSAAKKTPVKKSTAKKASTRKTATGGKLVKKPEAVKPTSKKAAAKKSTRKKSTSKRSNNRKV